MGFPLPFSLFSLIIEIFLSQMRICWKAFLIVVSLGIALIAYLARCV